MSGNLLVGGGAIANDGALNVTMCTLTSNTLKSTISNGNDNGVSDGQSDGSNNDCGNDCGNGVGVDGGGVVVEVAGGAIVNTGGLPRSSHARSPAIPPPAPLPIRRATASATAMRVLEPTARGTAMASMAMSR